jgi:hypothetical protein
MEGGGRGVIAVTDSEMGCGNWMVRGGVGV